MIAQGNKIASRQYTMARKRHSKPGILGEIILREMVINGYPTEDDLAKAMGIANSTISKTITGRTRPRIETLHGLATILHVPLEILAKASAEDANRYHIPSEYLTASDEQFIANMSPGKRAALIRRAQELNEVDHNAE
jgi:transcriptional regulator with XRE-family HTH domain